MNARNTKGRGARLSALLPMALLSLLLALAGCGAGGAGESASGGTGGQAAGVSATLSAYARSTPGGAAAQAFALAKPQGAQVLVNGQLLVESIDRGTQEIYNWALTVDESAFSIVTAVTLNLDSGRYNFYFLLHGGDHSYAGSAENWQILNASGTTTNTIPFTLNPVISDGPVDVRTIRTLQQFSFGYNFAEIRKYSDPSFSIRVNAGAVNVFNINVRADQPYVLVLLPPGRYRFEVRFYDGAEVKLVGDQLVDLPGDGTIQLSLGSLVTVVNYEVTPGAGAGVLTFVVPRIVVDAAGGAQQLVANAAVVGPATPLAEGRLALAPTVDDPTSYQGDLTVPGLAAGDLTFSIQFRRTDGTLFGYCVDRGSIPAATGSAPLSGSFACTPRLLAGEVGTATPMAHLAVSVKDSAGQVPGVVVSAGPDAQHLAPIGITADGSLPDELPGQILSFLPGGLYEVDGVETILQSDGTLATRTAQAFTGLTPGQSSAVTLDLGAAPVPPPASGTPPGDDQPPGSDGSDSGAPAQDYIVVTAQRHNWPQRFLDGSVKLSGWAQIRIPQLTDIQVTQGDPNQYMLLLSFGRRGLKCWYLGGERTTEMTGWLDDLARNTFSNPVCTGGAKVGDSLWVRGPVRARVVVANRTQSITEATVRIPVIAVAEVAPEHQNDARPAWWRGRGFWFWWGWWHDDQDWRGDDEHPSSDQERSRDKH